MNTEKERVEFESNEALIDGRDEYFTSKYKDFISNGYVCPETQIKWESWLAAKQSAQKEVEDLKAANLNKQLIIDAKNHELEQLKQSEMTEDRARDVLGDTIKINETTYIKNTDDCFFGNVFRASKHEYSLEELKVIVFLMEHSK